MNEGTFISESWVFTYIAMRHIIQSIHAREILSSGATPTIEAEVLLESGAVGIASVPFGASAGSHEAAVLLDGDTKRYFGNGMLKAIEHIHTDIAPALLGMDGSDQRSIDERMKELDGTPNKVRFGGNAILVVSLAVARACAAAEKLPLYAYIRKAYQLSIQEYILPNPMMVVIEGGKHADHSTDLQEYMVSLIGNDSVRENVRRGIEIYHHLKKILEREGFNVNVGNEGAYAPAGIRDNELPLRFISEAIAASGYTPGSEVGISLDAAASEFYKDGFYHLSIEGKKVSSDTLIAYYQPWFQKYPIATIEDMLHEDDWDAWTKLTALSPVPNIGDDLTVTNVERLKMAIDRKAINAILIKLNQIGTLTETIDCCMMAREHEFMTVTSHRGGSETEDTAMIDLAVAVNSSFVKVGPSRGERVAKYNRLMKIEEEFGTKARVVGRDFRKIQ